MLGLFEYNYKEFGLDQLWMKSAMKELLCYINKIELNQELLPQQG